MTHRSAETQSRSVAKEKNTLSRLVMTRLLSLVMELLERAIQKVRELPDEYQDAPAKPCFTDGRGSAQLGVHAVSS